MSRRLLVATLLLCAAYTCHAQPILASGPVESYSPTAGVTVTMTIAGAVLPSSSLSLASCTYTTSSTTITTTRTVAALASTCKFASLDCTNNNAGACAGFRGYIVYTGPMTLVVTQFLNTYQLYSGQLNVRMPAVLNSTTTSPQVWIQGTNTNPINGAGTYNVTTNLQSIGTSSSLTAPAPTGSLIVFNMSMITALPVAYDQTSATAMMCASDGSSCVAQTVPYWNFSATGPPSSDQIANGPPTLTFQPNGVGNQNALEWILLSSLPSTCVTNPSLCLPASLSILVTLGVNRAALPTQGLYSASKIRDLVAAPSTLTLSATTSLYVQGADHCHDCDIEGSSLGALLGVLFFLLLLFCFYWYFLFFYERTLSSDAYRSVV